MGSQSVTNFSNARKRRIQHGIRGFQPDVPEASIQARQAGIAAIGSLAPSSAFAQALTSASVDTAAKILGELVGYIESAESASEIEEVLGKYGVGATEQHPYAKLAAGLRQELDERLSAASSKTEVAPSAADAIGSTVLDVIKRTFPDRAEPADVSTTELVKAIRSTPPSHLSPIFLKNLISSLLSQTFDAARETGISRERVDELVEHLGPALTSELANDLARVGTKPESIREKLKSAPGG